jgi:hypothetical protein
MKKTPILTALMLAVFASVALAVDAYSVKQVRDPRVLATKLTADFTSVVSTSDAARVTALESTITNIPAASITAGNMAVARLTNALNQTASAVTNVIVSADAKTNTFIVVPVGQVLVLRSFVVTQ